MNVVVDASVVVKTLMLELGSTAAEQVMSPGCTAPDLIVSECINAFRKAVLRGAWSPARASIAVQGLQRAPIVLEPALPVAERALELSLRLSLSSYDCVYLAMAEKLDATLVTADMRLVERCRMHDAAEFALRVVALGEPVPLRVQERAVRPYMARRKA